ncbi:MAG: F0F1 ATP synthase subunit B [Planctomycetes bacterium]|nr:F0F1 ATP synthase subunit B [Planctomycetota bacterium]
MRRNGIQRTVATAAMLVMVGAARALGSEGGDSPSLFTGDLGNIFWSLLTFFMVLVVLGKFAWKPMLGALQSREDFIRSSLEQAKADREAAEGRLKEYEAKLTAARQEATEIVEEGRRDAETVKHKIEDDAKASAAAMLDRAKREISIATDTAVKELYDVTGKLATDMASRIISKEINAQDHERLIAESIRELSTAGGNGKSEA